MTVHIINGSGGSLCGAIPRDMFDVTQIADLPKVTCDSCLAIAMDRVMTEVSDSSIEDTVERARTHRVIFKYPVRVTGETIVLDFPGPDAKIVHLDTQSGVPHIWVEHELPEEARTGETHRFIWVGTGQAEINDTWQHVGTIQQDQFVWHLYEVAP